MSWHRVCLWFGLAALALSGRNLAQAEGTKLALLVGVDKYPEGSGFSTLSYTERDVEQLAEVLLASGYRPEHLRVLTLKRGSENPRFLPTAKNIRREFSLLAGDRKSDDSLLVALSGHGITRKVPGADKARGYFCPIDADIDDADSLVSLEALYDALEKSQSGVKVMFVDACRNDPTEGRAAAIPFRSDPPPPSVAALFACSNGEVAWDAGDLGGGHGVYFHYVIEGLKGAADAEAGNRDGNVTLAELTAYTQDKVSDYVSSRRGKRQMPLLLYDGGRIILRSGLQIEAAPRVSDPKSNVGPSNAASSGRREPSVGGSSNQAVPWEHGAASPAPREASDESLLSQASRWTIWAFRLVKKYWGEFLLGAFFVYVAVDGLLRRFKILPPRPKVEPNLHKYDQDVKKMLKIFIWVIFPAIMTLCAIAIIFGLFK